MFLVLHKKVGIVSTLSKTIISDFWTNEASGTFKNGGLRGRGKAGKGHMRAGGEGEGGVSGREWDI